MNAKKKKGPESGVTEITPFCDFVHYLMKMRKQVLNGRI